MGVACILRAQTNTLSLADAKRIAFERNWDLLATKSGVDLATGQLLVTKEFPNPTLSASTADIGDREGSTTFGNSVWERSFDTIFAVNQLVEIAGKRHHRQTAARAGLLGAKARFWDAKRVLDQGVTKAYVAAALADESARILHESAGYMRHEQEIGEARFKAGDLAESDFKQIQVAAGQYLLQEAAAQSAAVQARTAVEVLLGVNAPRGEWQPVDSLEGISTNDSAKAEARTNGLRPDVLAATTDVRAAEANLKLQKAVRVPDPTFSVQYEHNPQSDNPPGIGPPSDTIGVGVSFPLPIWNQNRGAIDSARANVEQSRLTLEKLHAQMASDLVNAEAANHEASERLRHYRDEIRPQSSSARASVIFKFERGGATFVDLLEAERTDNDVRLATAQAMADTVSTAADLAAARMAITEGDLTQ